MEKLDQIFYIKENKHLASILRQKLAIAAQQAPTVVVEEGNRLDNDELSRQRESYIDLTTNEIVEYEFEEEPNSVAVDNIKDFPNLIFLALRQVLKSNYQLTDEDLAKNEIRLQYAQWYQTNLERHVSHELEHYYAAKKHTNLECKLGIRFYKRSHDGYINFHPFIDFQGSASSQVIREKVLNVSVPSEGDLAALGRDNT